MDKVHVSGGASASNGTARNSGPPNTDNLSQSEILALQKQWRLEKRREIEARNNKKKARQAQAEVSYQPPQPQPLHHQPPPPPPVSAALVPAVASVSHSAPPANPSLAPPVKRFKAAYLAETAAASAAHPAPAENTSMVYYTTTTNPAAATAVAVATPQQPQATYQHYELVGTPTDEQARTLEAQRAWKEQKLREIAEKRAKGVPSKRGRRKTALGRSPPPGAPLQGGDALIDATAVDSKDDSNAPLVTPMSMALNSSDAVVSMAMPAHTTADVLALAHQQLSWQGEAATAAFIGSTQPKTGAEALEQNAALEQQNAALEQQNAALEQQNAALEQQGLTQQALAQDPTGTLERADATLEQTSAAEVVAAAAAAAAELESEQPGKVADADVKHAEEAAAAQAAAVAQAAATAGALESNGVDNAAAAAEAVAGEATYAEGAPGETFQIDGGDDSFPASWPNLGNINHN